MENGNKRRFIRVPQEGIVQIMFPIGLVLQGCSNSSFFAHEGLLSSNYVLILQGILLDTNYTTK